MRKDRKIAKTEELSTDYEGKCILLLFKEVNYNMYNRYNKKKG